MPRHTREELERMGIDPADIEAYLAGTIDIAFERPPATGERTVFGDDLVGYGFGMLFNRAGVYGCGGVRGRFEERIPLEPGIGGRILPLLERLVRSGLRAFIEEGELDVFVWDDAESVHLQGTEEHVASVAARIREAMGQGE